MNNIPDMENAIYCDGSCINQQFEDRRVGYYYVTDFTGKIKDYGEMKGVTNNFAELMAVYKAVEVAKKGGFKIIYTDSNVVVSWLKRGHVKTRAIMKDRINKGIKMVLDSQGDIDIRFWDTKKYGNIPADPGNK